MGRVFIAKMGSSVWSSYSKALRNFVCLRYATDFHKVAHKTNSPIIRAFLLGQALELYLKAFLFSHGYSETTLKKRFGHNLKRLLDEAITKGLNVNIHISPAVHTDIEALNSVYESKALQYFSILYLLKSPKVPNLRRLFRFAVVLRGFLEKHIREPN